MTKKLLLSAVSAGRFVNLPFCNLRMQELKVFVMQKFLTYCLTGIVVLLTAGFATGQPAPELQLLEVQKIWDQAPHNAFTDLIRFNNRWFCVFREGEGHVSPDGALRVITSEDGKQWESAALITAPDMDLRDAKITLTPDGKLMLSGAGALHDKSVNTHQSLAWFSENGDSWSDSYPIGERDFWLWRTSWHNGKAYSMGYGCNNQRLLRLYVSNDGNHFKTLVEDLGITGYPNETAMVFSGDTAFCLLRRDGDEKSGLLGISLPPYTNWQWKDLGTRIGGPQMIQLPDGRLLAAVRLYGGDGWHPARTSLCWVDARKGTITEVVELPSGGDTSYPGMVFHEGVVWVSYYSSHQEKTSIYLAKVKMN
jgi:hypothetical protein